MVKTQCTKQRFLSPQVILPNLSERTFGIFSSRGCTLNLWPTLQTYLILFITSDDSCETVARCHFSNQQSSLSTSTLSQTVHRRCFCYGSSVLPTKFVLWRPFVDFDLLYVTVSLSSSCFCIEIYFICFMFGAVQFLNVFFILSHLSVQFI